MWLLDIETRRLECFGGRNVPPYAILSHRWTGNEVSFQDVQEGRASSMESYSKIANFCERISMDGLTVRYVWIDTCCIDKNNNTELSEAINSMYRWYRQAEVCYAYLVDVSGTNISEFCASSWFTRGWTLQELLAPDNVQFFDREWNPLGTKLELSEHITRITGIPVDALEHFDSRRSPHSVADRMSWAAQRETTREEDLAYSLFGIFGVNMPLLYGEGSRAFLRLQEEILKISEDLTLFAWSRFPRLLISNDYLRDTGSHDFGLFAASPESFSHKDKRFHNLLETVRFNEGNLLDASFSGAGLALNLVLVPHCPEIYIAPLCEVTELVNQRLVDSRKVAAMFVERSQFDGRYQRVLYNGQSLIIDRPENLNIAMGRTQRVVLERKPYHAMARAPREKYGFNILQIEADLLRLFKVTSQDSIDILKRHSGHQSLFMESGEVGVAGIIRLGRRHLPPIFFHFGFDFDFNPFCLISKPLHKDSNSHNYQIHFETSAKHVVPVDCNMGILRLVNLLKADRRRFHLEHHNLELHMGSWRSTEMHFVGRDCKISLDVSAGHAQGYVYHVNIGMALQDYPWAAPEDSSKTSPVSKGVRWYCSSWEKT